MQRSTINTELVRRRRAELGVSLRQISAVVGMRGPGYAAIENGSAGSEMGLGSAGDWPTPWASASTS